jgi:hypothetical protein
MVGNACDHDHDTTEETRRLPLYGGAGLILCKRHYESETQAWDDVREVPAWASLPVYSPAVFGTFNENL